MLTRQQAFLWLVLAGTSPFVSALTVEEVNVVCPLDGTSFRTSQAMSGTRFGMFLDLKPFGPIAAPWPIPKCPSNGFVIYKTTFSSNEIDRLRPYVAAKEYQSLQATETNYYLASKLQRVLREPIGLIAYTLLQATWEAKSSEQYAIYAAEALDSYELLLKQPYTDQQQLITDQLVAGELERRLGKFEEAKARFTSLSRRGDLKDGQFRAIVDLQLKLVASRDAKPSMLPR